MQQGIFDSPEQTPESSNEDMEVPQLCSEVLEEITDEVILGLCFEVHRAVKLNILFLDEPKEDEKKYEIVDETGLDVFGQTPMKKQFECVCPHCQRNLAASRFAPHLEKCMGMGRNSSRLANKRIANSGKVESDIDDYDNDSDWNYNTDRKTTKRKRDKNSPRRSTKIKGKNGDSVTGSSSEGNLLANYEIMTLEERKAVLMQICGVVSEHTKKMCTRSHRCPQHTDEQRRYLRHSLLGRNTSLDTADEVHVDVDTVEDESQVLRLWDSGNSANPSPADSSSTSNGATSVPTKKKEKKVPPTSVPKNTQSGFPKKSKSKTPQNFSGSCSSQNTSGPSSVDMM